MNRICIVELWSLSKAQVMSHAIARRGVRIVSVAIQ